MTELEIVVVIICVTAVLISFSVTGTITEVAKLRYGNLRVVRNNDRT